MPSNGAAASEDVGNIVSLEHVNITVPDQILATWFYVVGLGFTRDPYMNVTPRNMWVNVGEQEFHLPTRGPQVVPGHVGLVVPDIDQLKMSLKSVEEPLAGTQFSWAPEAGFVSVTCPWGNRFRCYTSRPDFGTMSLGIPYIELLIPPGSAKAVARFYERVLQTPAFVGRTAGEVVTVVRAGRGQSIRFLESADAPAQYPGHHIAVYVANMSAPFGFFQKHDLVMEELRNHQFRFQKIIDPDSGDVVAELEHEVRGLQHPMYSRAFVNRNPAQNQANYMRGQDVLQPVL